MDSREGAEGLDPRGRMLGRDLENPDGELVLAVLLEQSRETTQRSDVVRPKRHEPVERLDRTATVAEVLFAHAGELVEQGHLGRAPTGEPFELPHVGALGSGEVSCVEKNLLDRVEGPRDLRIVGDRSLVERHGATHILRVRGALLRRSDEGERTRPRVLDLLGRRDGDVDRAGPVRRGLVHGAQPLQEGRVIGANPERRLHRVDRHP
jgi:hypothetical protein